MPRTRLTIAVFIIVAAVSRAQQPSDSSLQQLGQELIAAMQSNDSVATKRLLKKLVVADPENPDAWSLLAELQMQDGEIDEAIASARKQLDVNPSNKQAASTLVFALSARRQFDDAVAVLKKQLPIRPNDAKLQFALAGALSNAGHYDEAMKYFESAAKADPSDIQVNYALALARVQSGSVEEAIAIVDRLPDGYMKPYVLDNMGYQLAIRNRRLDKAQQYAKQAEAATVAELKDAKLSQIDQRVLDNVSILASEWRTLGLIALRQNKLVDAQRYMEAAWALQPYAQYGQILRTVYQKQGNEIKASGMAVLSQVAPRLPETNDETAQFIAEKPSPYAGPLMESSRQQFEAMRTVKLARELKETVSAEFWLLVSKAGVEDSAFISGAEQLRSWNDTLKKADLKMEFPDEVPVNIVRRGTVSCYAPSSECKLVLMEPRDFLHAR
jgi:tetratricopeptide (TPR) repeat protein